MANDSAEGLRVALADRYLLGEELGHGGMAIVYRARDLRHDRDVAVKVMRPELASILGADQFLREIQIAARLTHPHITAVHDSGTAAGQLYFVMPLAAGETLAQRLAREGPLPLDDALRITADVAEALSYAHSHGVVHRDIKPGNILLSSGHAQVADFGLARAVQRAQGESVSEAGIVVGTPEYMSPEQSAGGTVDGRSDTYALGCVVYEMLAGEPPFRGRTAQAILARHIADPVPSLRTVRAGVPAATAKVIENALAKMPADRYATATAFADALAASVPPRAASRSWTGVLVALAIAALAAAGAWRLAGGRAVGIDPNTVVGFPLVEVDSAAAGRLDGERVAIMIGSALEHAEPLRWADGWSRLGPASREDIRKLNAADARRITREAGGKYYLDGRIVRIGDSATVMLMLHDAQRDVVVSRASASGAADPGTLLKLGYQAVNAILPSLLGGRAIDRTAMEALGDRQPSAVANWIQGELYYRRARYDSAMTFLGRAVQEDSGLAIAAIRGAEAAYWEDQPDAVAAFIQAASRRRGTLPPKYAAFLQGFESYQNGAADSAVAQFGRALALDSTWSGAWTALGEVYYHLSQDVPTSDSLAAAAFGRARQFDPEFTPNQYHLAELALRRGELAESEAILRALDRGDASGPFALTLRLAVNCLRGGMTPESWREAAATAPVSAVLMAHSLAAGLRSVGCAEEGFRAGLAAPGASETVRWDALLGLHNLLVATGRSPEAIQLLDAEVGGMPAANFLYFVDAWAGVGGDEQAGRAAEFIGLDFDAHRSSAAWAISLLAAARRDSGLLQKTVVSLDKRATVSQGPLDSMLAKGAAARLALLRDDTAAALALLAEVRAVSPPEELGWGVWDAFAVERIQRARLLMARGDYASAAGVAGSFDHPQAIMNLLFAGEALAIRAVADSQRGRLPEAAALRQRARAATSGVRATH